MTPPPPHPLIPPRIAPNCTTNGRKCRPHSPRRLSEENRSLRLQQEQLANERSTLLAKNEQARARVEAMIARLKSLEQHT